MKNTNTDEKTVSAVNQTENKRQSTNIAPHNVGRAFNRLTGEKVFVAEWENPANVDFSDSIVLYLTDSRIVRIPTEDAAAIVRLADNLIALNEKVGVSA